MHSLQVSPFPYVIGEEFLRPDDASDVLTALERCSWTAVAGKHFEFGELQNVNLLEMIVQKLNERRVSSAVRDLLTTAFKIPLSTTMQAAAHRYRPGEGIGPHTDEGVKAARFILNLNRDWKPEHGGIWLLGNNIQLQPAEPLAPKSNSGFGFISGPETYHAMSERTFGESFAFIFEFSIVEGG
jgi:Rps23 Pro-64 3,4-dihydroxylase Tpa1-like proline 4-hydroxylase